MKRGNLRNLEEIRESMNFITGNKFKELADDFIDQSKPYIDLSKKPKTIFLFTDWVDTFKESILPKIDYQFKLITHNADHGIYVKDLDLLNDPRLIQWYGMNCHVEHEKLTPIPIGIANAQWPHGDEDLLRKTISKDIPKKNRIYCNYDVKTNPLRSSILSELKGHPLVDFETEKLHQSLYWEKLASYQYVIPPPGNSEDCHRIWESLYLGTIPICLNSISLNTFRGLPIILRDSYKNLTLPPLKDSVSCKLANMEYWKGII